MTGLLFYVGQVANPGTGSVTYVDDLLVSLIGMENEMDDYPPPTYRYAVSIRGFIFAGGGITLGAGVTCTTTNGSSLVTISSDALYDGIKGWQFHITGQNAGGVDGRGLFYANYVDAHTLQLIGTDGLPKNFVSSVSTPAGSGLVFVLNLPSNVIRWSKQYEPEAWPLENSIQFSGEVTGLIQIPNQSLLLVCTDEPSMYILDLNLIGTASFKTNRYLISSTFSATSHYSLVAVEGKVRGIDASLGCIFEVYGSVVTDITKLVVPKIFKMLSTNMGQAKNWHCAYDQRQKMFGAFVTHTGAHKMVDFCIGQNVATGSWFFNWEKDLLSTGSYVDPVTGEYMVLGGTQGEGLTGAVWGRIWTPDVYSDWFPGGLRSGTLVSLDGPLSFTVDNTTEDLYTGVDGLKGRWVLVTSPKDEFAQLGFITSNTANQITLASVVGGMDPTTLNPAPDVGWKFYIGLIECRWGPKMFDFGDPDTMKKIMEVWCCVANHDTTNLPFVRVYRGFDTGYTEQLSLQEHLYLDKVRTQTLSNKTSNKLEPVQRWGLSWIDRSYGETTLRSISLVFMGTPVGFQNVAKGKI